MNLAEILELSTTDYILLALLAIMVYRWFKRRNEPEIEMPKPVVVPPLPRQDMTLSELRKYDGVHDEHILFGLNGTIYDVSRGKSFYGPGGPYGTLAGRDATRALGTMDAKAVRDEWDDCTDLKLDECNLLKPDERESADEWESSFKFKYPTVGRLVKDASEKKTYAEGEMSKVQDWVLPSKEEKKAN
ncbi:vem-1 [Pristionchus pacificus]|uniref:Vem-1 n=1 Tax=Pristionchus pacificus TaxID=54126 RepID=A0A2A6CI74_PRIPA|nr:vem-1 [Pristionchus pacificus]|eukprot:PDM77721.1 vem-1 [Pristionchus pacificus]